MLQNRSENAELKHRHGLDVARASGLFNIELQAATVVNMKRIKTLMKQHYGKAKRSLPQL